MAEPPPPSRFPPELVDEVIDHLWDDNKALTACSLVCRSWSQRSFYHLFNEINLSLSPITSFSFVALGRSNILPHIKMVIITRDLDKAEMPQALSLLRAYSTPRILILDSVNLISNISGILKFILPTSSVETLQLKNCELHPSAGILDILSALPGLDSLILYHKNMSADCPIDPIQYTLPIPPRLSALYLNSRTTAVPFLKFLDAAASQLTLHTLRLGAIYIESAHTVIEVLAALPSLRDLSMTIVFLPHVLPSLGLPTLTNLQLLDFEIFPRDLTLLCTFITDLLWNLPSIHMEIISLKFFPLHDTAKASVVKPSEAVPALPVLKKLHISFNFDSGLAEDYSWLGEMLTTQFSTYDERGILVL